MNFRNLTWDSDFFGCFVGRLDIDKHSSLDELKNFVERMPDFDICYIFNHSQASFFDQILATSGAILYDRKVTFGKVITQISNGSVSHDVVELKKTDSEIIALAVASGINSRYYLDPRFRSKQPELYERWIKNCFEDSCGKVLGIYRDGILAAVAGITVADGCGHLELIAVAPAFRRLGLAKKLINSAEDFYAKSGCCRAEIVTQKDNLPACMTYSTCGYSMSDCVDVWHLWKTNSQNSGGC